MSTRLYRTFTRRFILPWALQGLEPAGEALEIGAGGGAMAAQILASFPDLRMVVTDYDPDMVAAALHAIEPFGDRATVEQADATDLPFADDRFDLVLSCAMLHHTSHWQHALSEAFRVLRPGGRLVGFDVLPGAPLHRGRQIASSTINQDRLRSELRTLATDVRTRPSRANLAVRFVATKRS